jgi:hypothetical protein
VEWLKLWAKPQYQGEEKQKSGNLMQELATDDGEGGDNKQATVNPGARN